VLNVSEREKFGCLKDFSSLNGREKQYVIVGDNPDARIAKLLFRSRVAKNWPSQWHTRYKAGYIEFENGKKFDLANQTIRGKSVFLFPDTPGIHILWLRQTLENKIRASVDKLPTKDKSAATPLIRKFIEPAIPNYPFRQHPVLELLPFLSVCQLEELAEQFAERRDGQTGSSPGSCADGAVEKLIPISM
jgi:hypothetical protein